MEKLARYITNTSKDALVYMPYLTIADPNLAATEDFSLTMIDAGADLLELGIPFSDPIADGPIIQSAMDRALGNVQNQEKTLCLEDVFSLCNRIHLARPKTPLIFLSYLNPIINGFRFLELKSIRGAPKKTNQYLNGVRDNFKFFLEECQRTGVCGLVIPDLPFDQPESKILQQLAPEYGVAQILVISPNTSQYRLKEICAVAEGWIYYVSSFGVTGMRDRIPDSLADNIDKLKQFSDVPILAGFGFHKPEQIISLRKLLDGVIVGSMNQSIIATYEEYDRDVNNIDQIKQELYDRTKAFVEVCHSSTK